MKQVIHVIVLLTIFLITGCMATDPSSVEEKRNTIIKMQQATLAKLYAQKPDVRQQVKSAPGYAVFDNANVNLIIASVGGGYGVVTNNRSGQKTFMNMAEAGLGLGLGAKEFNVVMVFHSPAAMNRFIEFGWAFGGNADAAAKHQHHGAAIAAEAVVDDVTIYSLTDTGIALQAVLKGTKFWVDKELNE
ncbi:putative lipoprotein [Pseudoalteromonas luteoviolacea B = ATCC 29581]|nr:putative lipoprotein [Pseudoalteromonas luteoviolacea B = ATCC 29581]